MSSTAGVLSIERLARLGEALSRFANAGQTALGLADMEIRRAIENLEDRLRHWQHQVTRCREEMAQARASLAYARAVHEGKSVGCVEQELDLRKAQERVHYAEEKVATCKRWLRELPTYLKEYEGPARSLGGFLETEVRQAVVQLDNKVAALSAYLSVAAPDPKESS
jgi:chromosome segregation ATPase